MMVRSLGMNAVYFSRSQRFNPTARIKALTVTVAAVPELSTWVLMLIGFAGFGFAGFRASNRTAA